MQRERRRPHILLIHLGLAVATLVAYESLRLNDFVAFDDDHYVENNTHVQSGLTSDSISWAFTTTTLNNWHPLTWLSYMLDVSLFGGGAGTHAAVNVALHAATSVLLFVALRTTRVELWIRRRCPPTPASTPPGQQRRGGNRSGVRFCYRALHPRTLAQRAAQ